MVKSHVAVDLVKFFKERCMREQVEKIIKDLELCLNDISKVEAGAMVISQPLHEPERH